MTSLNITLPDALRTWIDERVRRGGFASVDDYIAMLVRDDRRAEDTDPDVEDWLRHEVVPAYAAFNADRSTGKNAEETLAEILER